MQSQIKKGHCCNDKKTHLVIFDFGIAGKRIVKLCSKHHGKEPFDEYVISDKIIGDLLE